MYHSFFMLAQGINKDILIPSGSIDDIREHIEHVEQILSITREQYMDNPIHWSHNNYEKVSDKVLCKMADEHNKKVIDFYYLLEKYANNPPPDNFEILTPNIFSEILPGLEMINVPAHRWDGDYYTMKMETLYQVMRGNETEGISFDAPKLSIKQAASVIRLFSEFLDHDDRRLEVPKGEDYLASSYDGGYMWCEKCGAVLSDIRCYKKKCPLDE